MSDFKTRFNPLFVVWMLIATIVYGKLFHSTYYSIHNSNATEFNKYGSIILVFITFSLIFLLAMKPYFKRAKNYLIKDNSIEEFNFFTFKTKTINKADIKGFSTSIFYHGIWKFKEIIIYTKDGSKINIMQFVFFNFKNIESELLAKNYNFLGSEPYKMKFFGSRIYKYDSDTVNSEIVENRKNTVGEVHSKIELVFVPYLIVSLSIVIGWTILDWLLFTKLNVFQVDFKLRTIVIPLILSVISFFIWLFKRINLLRLDVVSTKGRDDVAYFLILTFAIVGTSYFTQKMFTLTTGKLTNLSSISQIEQKEPTKFYSLKNFYLDKNQVCIKKEFKTSGKFHSNLETSIYITVPILNSVKDTLGSTCIGWYGIQYTDKVNGFIDDYDIKGIGSDFNKSNLNKIENSAEVKKIVSERMLQFNNLNLNQFLYLERIFKTESDFEYYESAIKNNTKYNTIADVVLLPCKESLTERAKDYLIYALTVFGIFSLLFFLMVNSSNLKSEDEVRK